MKSLKLSFVLGVLFVVNISASFADKKIYSGKDKYRAAPSWKSETTEAVKAPAGLKLCFKGEKWSGAQFLSWGNIEHAASIRITFHCEDTEALKTLTFKGRFGDRDTKAKGGSVVHFGKYKLNTSKKGHYYIDIPIDDCDPDVSKQIFMTMIGSMVKVEFTLISIETITAYE